jgi:uncharacterized protein YdhG (YjbR/CyaY superfamily)
MSRKTPREGSGIKDVDQYLLGFSPTIQERLEAIRRIILEQAPEALEGIAYGMPAYKLCGRPLVYFAGFPRHIGFYATPSGHEAFARELAGYKQGKGSVQFPHDRELPLDLIARMVAFRADEN